MSYHQSDRDYYHHSNKPTYEHPAHRQQHAYEESYFEEHKARQLPQLPAPGQGYGQREHKQKSLKPILKLENHPRHRERGMGKIHQTLNVANKSSVAFESPAISPESTYSARSSQLTFSDWTDAESYNSYQNALTTVKKNAQEDEEFDILAETEKRRKLRNKTLLYAGLACVTTVATSNNIYQGTKAHMGRHYEREEKKMGRSDLEKFNKKSLMADAISLGIAGICLNNTRKGWMRYEALKKEQKKTQAAWKKKVQEKRERQEEALEEYFLSTR